MCHGNDHTLLLTQFINDRVRKTLNPTTPDPPRTVFGNNGWFFWSTSNVGHGRSHLREKPLPQPLHTFFIPTRRLGHLVRCGRQHSEFHLVPPGRSSDASAFEIASSASMAAISPPSYAAIRRPISAAHSCSTFSSGGSVSRLTISCNANSARSSLDRCIARSTRSVAIGICIAFISSAGLSSANSGPEPGILSKPVK